jgi:hypothetical protein
LPQGRDEYLSYVKELPGDSSGNLSATKIGWFNARLSTEIAHYKYRMRLIQAVYQ